GECWIFDNWRLHRVENASDQTRVHLVADTVGTAAFWNFVARGEAQVASPGAGPLVPFDPSRAAPLLTERFNAPAVMSPGEIEGLVAGLCDDLAVTSDGPEAASVLRAFRALCVGFVREWRAMWALHGDSPSGRDTFRALCGRAWASAQAPGATLVM